ncbi:MAG: four helix bundle protein [Chloroflexota bacterium]|nr:four helix bundle protein [Chloroflexota bacterium]
MQDYRKLRVWQKSHELTLAVYRASERFPKAEVYGITSQMRRSSSSIPTNIAEGCGRSSKADFLRFLHVALGSINELSYQLLLCRDLGILDTGADEGLAADALEIQRMLGALILKIKADSQDIDTTT